MAEYTVVGTIKVPFSMNLLNKYKYQSYASLFSLQPRRNGPYSKECQACAEGELSDASLDNDGFVLATYRLNGMCTQHFISTAATPKGP